jgi:hypothetical protein
VDNVHVVRAGNAGVYAFTGSSVVVTNSMISDSNYGVAAFGGINLAGMVALGTARVVVKRSTLTTTSTGTYASAYGGGAFADAVVSDSTLTRNSIAFSVDQSGGGASTITCRQQHRHRQRHRLLVPK